MKHQAAANDHHGQVAQLEMAGRELEEAQTIDEIRDVRDHAEAIRAYAQHRDLGLELQNQAAELKLRAERRLGRKLAEMNLRGGDRKSKGPTPTLKLKDLGIDKNQSARWQLEASVPEEVFRHYLLNAHAEGREISSAALLRIGRQMKQLQAVPPTPTVRDRELPSNIQVLAIRGEPRPRTGPLSELGDLVDEVKNHGRTLTSLMESICEQANVASHTCQRRAMRRYLREIEGDLDQIQIVLQRLTQDRTLLSSACAS